MNYLFYLGIIIPTLITIVLFLVFIYCWFLQKARKEVLTKRYDPHGKMRRLGIPMDPPSPPPYCRIGSDFFTDSGEDNEAYDVSRSPSTEQNIRGRPMYRTYHDSGISAGLSPTQDNEPRPQLAYRSCPDSGISGFGVHSLQTSACVHYHACSGCCQDGTESIHIQQLHSQQQTSPLSVCVQQQQQILHQNQQIQHHSCQPQGQMPLQHNQVILHHNTVQASVHPNHGVCYGDDTTHLQSPQHYNPPPFHQHTHTQAIEIGAVGGGGNTRHPPPDVNTLPHIQEQPTPCVLQRTNGGCCNHTSPQHLKSASTSPQQPSSPPSHTQACCHCHNQPYHYHHQQLSSDHHSDSMTVSQPQLSQQCSSLPSYNQRDDLTNISSPTNIQAHYVNRDGGVPDIDPSTFKPKHFHTQPKDPHNSVIPPGIEYPPSYQPNAPTTSTTHPPTPQRPMHSYRDSGLGEMGQSINNISPSDRPDSQASTSSTTDSEDSGFRSSHCAVQHNNKLNKHDNPLLKPLRRTKNSAKPKSKSGNTDSQKKTVNFNGSATPLTTPLNPHNLSSQHDERSNNDVIQTTSLLDRGEVTNRKAPRQTGSPGHSNRTIPQHSPKLEQEWSFISPITDTDSKAKQSQQGQQQQQQQHFDVTDISTHLSWKYLQDISAASGKSTGSDESSSSTDDSHRVVSPLLRHAPPDQSMDMFSYSVV